MISFGIVALTPLLIFEIFSASLLLWIFFIVFANIKKYRGEEYPSLVRVIVSLIILLFFIFDVAFNVTYGSIAFMELPREFTLTARLKRLLHDEPQFDWRTKLASFVCRKMIEPWDWNHCGLNGG